MVVKLDGLNKLANDIAKDLESNTFILLNGDLGAGKTTFTKQLIKELGVTESITSPSFNIMNQYRTDKHIINHMDAYRLRQGDEIDMFIEAFEDAITIVEWPSNLLINYCEYGKVIEIYVIYIDENTREFNINK